MRIGSLFSGVGGLERGIERALVEWLMGFPTGWSESEPSATLLLPL